MYNGEMSEEKDTSENNLPNNIPPAYIRHSGIDIPLDNVVPSSSSQNGYRRQREPSFTSKPPPSDNKMTTTNSSATTPDNHRSSSNSDSNVTVHFHDAELTRNLYSAVHPDQDSTNASHARQLNGFFSVLALCHTVLTTVDKETGKIEYKAQSPDEAALVQAAADVGFVFKGREKEVLLLQTPFGSASAGGPAQDEDEIIGRRSQSLSSGTIDATSEEGTLERYELLNILEFTSARKRMSVVLRKVDGDDGRVLLLSKGADNIIFERLKPGSEQELKRVTEKHLDEFASQGLRTLTLAYKVIGGKFFLIPWT